VVERAREIGEEIDNLLYDPQTSGGLLISLPEKDAAELTQRLEGAYRIGRVVESGTKPIRLI
jgi:selenide,water dikinase